MTLTVGVIAPRLAAAMVVEHHYLHRRPMIQYAWGLENDGELVGVVTFGTPASRHLQMGVMPAAPNLVIELNRLWVHNSMPRNTESWFVSRAIKALPSGLVVVSYADTKEGHAGYVYRALNFRYAGWTDMDRKTPRYDYIPVNGGHTRDAFRGSGGGVAGKVRRKPKVRYWTVTGPPAVRRNLMKEVQWPSMDWHTTPPPGTTQKVIDADP